MYGTGQHRWELSDHDASTALLVNPTWPLTTYHTLTLPQFWYLCELLYVLSNCTLKIALGIFYLRIAMKTWHVWSIRILMIGTVVFGTVYFFLVMLQCLPISEFWLNHPASSKCIPQAATTGITYALGAVNAFADWSFGILPFFIVWDLQMNIRTKMLVAGILAFAAIGSTATVVRMQYIDSLTNGTDFLWATKDVAIWSTVEPGVGITAGSIATLRPLFQTLFWRLGLASAPASARARTPSQPSRARSAQKEHRGHSWFGLGDLVPSQGSTSTTISGPELPSKSTHSRGLSGRSGKESVVGDVESGAGLGGIRQSVVVEQEYEGPPRLQLRHSLRHSLMRGSVF